MAITRTTATSVATTTTAATGKAATRPAGTRARARARNVAATRAAVATVAVGLVVAAPRMVARAASEAQALLWGLQALGWAPREAGNIVAIAQGLQPARHGWTIREIEHLRFLRSIVRAGRIAS